MPPATANSDSSMLITPKTNPGSRRKSSNPRSHQNQRGESTASSTLPARLIEHRLDQVMRPLLHLFEHPPQVIADDGQAEELRPAEKEIALGHGVERVDPLPIHQREVTRVGGNLHVAESAEEPVEGLVGEAQKRRGLALDALAVDDLVPLAPLLEELRDDLGRVLQV